jgi:hypothetical protein
MFPRLKGDPDASPPSGAAPTTRGARRQRRGAPRRVSAVARRWEAVPEPFALRRGGRSVPARGRRRCRQGRRPCARPGRTPLRGRLPQCFQREIAVSMAGHQVHACGWSGQVCCWAAESAWKHLGARPRSGACVATEQAPGKSQGTALLARGHSGALPRLAAGRAATKLAKGPFTPVRK